MAKTKPFADVTAQSDPVRVRAALLSALTAYDERQARGKWHNRYALAHYCGALQRAMDRWEGEGMSLRAALVESFTGRLLDVVLKSVGEAKSTDAEQRF